jgi:hypothetical protein
MSDAFNHLGSIWYHSEPSDIPNSQNQFLGWDFFCHFLQQDSSSFCNFMASLGRYLIGAPWWRWVVPGSLPRYRGAERVLASPPPGFGDSEKRTEREIENQLLLAPLDSKS